MLVMFAVLIYILSGLWVDNIIYVVRTYEEIDGNIYEYTAGQMILYAGQLVGELLLFWGVRIKLKHEKLPRSVAQWAIDMVVVDLVYVLFSNPYKWNNSKLMSMGIATLMFITVYYFEYISLWHYTWITKIKNIYAKFKNNKNGGTP